MEWLPVSLRPLEFHDKFEGRFEEEALLSNDDEDEFAPTPILVFRAEAKDVSDPSEVDFFSEADTFRSRTVFISLRKATILSGGMPTVGMPARRDAGKRGLIGFSTGVGACRSDARAEAKREGSEV